MAANPTNNPLPFDALEQDWTLLCQQHRRSHAVARWSTQEPALAGVRRLAQIVPPPGTDRTPITAAVARLHVQGDDLAGRALLQLLVPGMIRLTARWHRRFPGRSVEAGWEIITRASLYIALLRHRDIRCAPAGYVLTSIARDLAVEARHRHAETQLRVPWADLGDRDTQLANPSAEDVVAAGPLIRDALDQAVNAGDLRSDTAELLWQVLTGMPVPDAAARTRTPTSTAYRHLTRASAVLHRHLHDDTTERGER